MAEKAFGKSMKRREDPAFITAPGNHMGDVELPRMAHAAILRAVPLRPEKVWRAMQDGSHGNGSGG